MEKEKKITETDEKSINEREYTKEFNILNQLKGLIDFNLYRKPIVSENNFYETIAWYIDYLQKENEATREMEIQKFIDSLKNFQGTPIEKLRYIDRFFAERKINWYEKNGLQKNAESLKFGPQQYETLKKMFIPKEDGKVRIIFPGIISKGIPDRYRTRFTESGLESKVIEENRRNFAAAMRHGMEKAEELKKEL